MISGSFLLSHTTPAASPPSQLSTIECLQSLILFSLPVQLTSSMANSAKEFPNSESNVALFALTNFNCLHTTSASVLLQKSSQTGLPATMTFPLKTCCPCFCPPPTRQTPFSTLQRVLSF